MKHSDDLSVFKTLHDYFANLLRLALHLKLLGFIIVEILFLSVSVQLIFD